MQAAFQTSQHFDLTTKFTVVYLALSALSFAILTIRFLPQLLRFRAPAATSGAQENPSDDARGSRSNAVVSAKQAAETDYSDMRVVAIALRKWAKADRA